MPQTPSESWTDGLFAVAGLGWSYPTGRSEIVTGVRPHPGADAPAMNTVDVARQPDADLPGRGASVVVAADLCPENAGGKDLCPVTGTTNPQDPSRDRGAVPDRLRGNKRDGTSTPIRHLQKDFIVRQSSVSPVVVFLRSSYFSVSFVFCGSLCVCVSGCVTFYVTSFHLAHF